MRKEYCLKSLQRMSPLGWWLHYLLSHLCCWRKGSFSSAASSHWPRQQQKTQSSAWASPRTPYLGLSLKCTALRAGGWTWALLAEHSKVKEGFQLFSSPICATSHKLCKPQAPWDPDFGILEDYVYSGFWTFCVNFFVVHLMQIEIDV